MAYEIDKGLKEVGEANLIKDFMKRIDTYSSLGWRNRKGLDKASTSWQVPAFAINFFSPKAIAHLKRHTEVYEALRNVNLVFQYIKYKPKEAVRVFTQRQLKSAKYAARWVNMQRRRQGLKPLPLPTRESLGIKEKVENFKATYPQIKKRMRDGTIDTIKSDWSWYLVGFATGHLKDGQAVSPNYFFQRPAHFYARTKDDIVDKIYKRTKKILSEIETLSENFIYATDDMAQEQKKLMLQLAYSLTPKGLREAEQRERELEAEQELARLRNEGAVEDIRLDLDWEELNS